jgi:tRNA1(Val) A37 N6-methylase TrmN6
VERFTAGWFENLPLSEWLPAVPDVRSKLEQGASVADVGCGAGRARIKLATELPATACTGYDAFDARLARARTNARAAKLDGRITFARRDVPLSCADHAHDNAGPIAQVLYDFSLLCCEGVA